MNLVRAAGIIARLEAPDALAVAILRVVRLQEGQTLEEGDVCNEFFVVRRLAPLVSGAGGTLRSEARGASRDSASSMSKARACTGGGRRKRRRRSEEEEIKRAGAWLRFRGG